MGRDEIDAILDPLNDDELLIAMPKIIKNLEAENQRLREALTRIYDMLKTEYKPDEWDGRYHKMWDIVKNGLTITITKAEID